MGLWLRLGLGLAVQMALSTEARADHYFVNPRAPLSADAGSGSRSHPFRSLEKAASVLRPGDTCFLASGTYRTTLAPVVSGFPGAPIVFAAMPGAKPVLSGLDSARGKWARGPRGLYRLRLPASAREVLQVFLDGKPLPENTWPAWDTGFSIRRFRQVTRATKLTPSRWCLQDSALPLADRDGYWVGAHVWILFGVKTSAHILPIDEHRAGRICFDHFSGDPAYFPSRSDGKSSYFALLKRPSDTALLEAGQWAYDSLRRDLRIRFRAGDSPARHRIEYRARLQGLALGRSAPIRFVRVEGVDFFAASIDFAGAESCAVARARIRYVTPFFAQAPPRDRILRSLNMADPRWRGVNLAGKGNAMEACDVDGSWGDGVSVSGTGNRVHASAIRNTDWIVGDFAPVSVWDSLHVIDGNALGATARNGLVHVDASACRILRNRIEGFGILTDDFGATYTVGTDGRGTEIIGNVLGPAAPQAGKFPNEPPDFAARMAGIYLDDADSGFEIRDNRVLVGQSAYSLRLNGRQRRVRVRDNVFLDAWGAVATYDCDEEDMKDVELTHNLLKGGLKPSDAGCGLTWAKGLRAAQNSEREADTAIMRAASADSARR